MNSKANYLPNVDLTKLGPRCAYIYSFLLNEIQFSEVMIAMNITVIQPLIDASKGAVLSAVKINNDTTTNNNTNTSNTTTNTTTDNHSEALFHSNITTISKSQALVIKEALSDPDVKIFLRAAEGISHTLKDFTSSLEILCNNYNWNENIQIGNFFNSVSALALYNQYKAYVDGQQAMLRILKTSPFLQFYTDIENYLNMYSGNINEKIEQPRNRVSYYMSFLSNLKSCIAINDIDYIPIETSLSALIFVNNEIQELIRIKTNFEKLLSIQSCFIGSNFLNLDPIIQKLASTDRTFIMEGDLKKVCRKKNKIFHFWLFNDYLIYGTAIGAGTYTFNRGIDLLTCTVKIHESKDTKNAFEVFGSEKSFVVIAPNTVVQNEWLYAIKTAKAIMVGSTVEEMEKNAVEVAAPLWVPDSESQGCIICKRVSCCVVL